MREMGVTRYGKSRYIESINADPYELVIKRRRQPGPQTPDRRGQFLYAEIFSPSGQLFRQNVDRQRL